MLGSPVENHDPRQGLMRQNQDSVDKEDYSRANVGDTINEFANFDDQLKYPNCS